MLLDERRGMRGDRRVCNLEWPATWSVSLLALITVEAMVGKDFERQLDEVSKESELSSGLQGSY